MVVHILNDYLYSGPRRVGFDGGQLEGPVPVLLQGSLPALVAPVDGADGAEDCASPEVLQLVASLRQAGVLRAERRAIFMMCVIHKLELSFHSDNCRLSVLIFFPN